MGLKNRRQASTCLSVLMRFNRCEFYFLALNSGFIRGIIFIFGFVRSHLSQMKGEIIERNAERVVQLFSLSCILCVLSFPRSQIVIETQRCSSIHSIQHIRRKQTQRRATFRAVLGSLQCGRNFPDRPHERTHHQSRIE